MKTIAEPDIVLIASMTKGVTYDGIALEWMKLDLSKFKNAREVNKEIRKLEKRIDTLTGALQVIDTWASFNGGSELRPIDVLILCKKVLGR